MAVFGLAIDRLAPIFGGERNRVQAMKLAVYAASAGWLAGVLLLVPVLGAAAGLIAVCDVYLLYLGLPRLMKVPTERVSAFVAAAILVAGALGLVVGLVLAWLTGARLPGALAAAAGF